MTDICEKKVCNIFVGLVLMLLLVLNCPEASIEQNKRANGFLLTVQQFHSF